MTIEEALSEMILADEEKRWKLLSFVLREICLAEGINIDQESDVEI